MINRDIQSELEEAIASYPVVTVTGPRQSGKTILVKSTFPNKPYFNLEEPDTRALVQDNPRKILEKYPEGIVFDEVQRVPELLSYIQVIVDEKDKNGLYVLTGSRQLELHQAISQSLAGRTAVLHLLPLSMQELAKEDITLSLNNYLLRGFLPRIYQKNLNPTKHYRAYVQTYLERDVRQIIHLKDLMVFQRFIKLCAGRVGQVLNMNSLGNALGVSNHTIKSWLSILQASYIITLLPPYFENFGKRIIKSPKLYFFDVGLATYLLDIETLKQLDKDPLRGHLLENLAVMELYKARHNRGANPNFYYYRDSQKHAVDLIYKQANSLIPIEIKSAKTLRNHFFHGLEYFQKLVGGRCSKGYVVYDGAGGISHHNFMTLNFKDIAEIVEEDS